MEITEHSRVTDYNEARKTIKGLREAGVHLAIDDAGAGYATFRHILRLRPDIIKMDQSITQHIDRDQARVALATALVIFASEIGAVVIAEGVETRGELAALQAAGVSRAQGFALSVRSRCRWCCRSRGRGASRWPEPSRPRRQLPRTSPSTSPCRPTSC